MSTAYTPPGVSIHIRNTSCSIFHKVPVQDYSHFDQYHLDIPADEAINVLLARNSFFFFSPIFSFDAQTFRSKSYNDSPFAYLLPKLDSVGAHRFALLFLPARYFARNRTARATVPHESNHVLPHYAHTYIRKRCRRSFCRDPRARATCGEGLM